MATKTIRANRSGHDISWDLAPDVTLWLRVGMETYWYVSVYLRGQDGKCLYPDLTRAQVRRLFMAAIGREGDYQHEVAAILYAHLDELERLIAANYGAAADAKADLRLAAATDEG